MGEPAIVTEADLARARQDYEFRRQLVADNLERLLAGLNKLRRSSELSADERERQLCEGVALAVKLSDLLCEMAEDFGGTAPKG
jgi:hypothetical protein